MGFKSGQYTNFCSFVPIQQKRNLVRFLAQRARKICSADCIEEELRNIENFLRENGYPDRSITKNLVTRPEKPTTLTAEKKTLFLKVPFQWDAVSKLLKRRLDQAVARTFPAATAIRLRKPVLCAHGTVNDGLITCTPGRILFPSPPPPFVNDHQTLTAA
ncbi:unnamed protein product [Schistocephalus solidus]|uniref:Helix-turn-helix domain-containing protein n=1 Tax=Schistocephalus solidus TaxID=70667 RepID=A0A183SYJ8_SCHSO|nr:unnamed protein product [Schistocephalus solidus]